MIEKKKDLNVMLMKDEDINEDVMVEDQHFTSIKQDNEEEQEQA